MDGLTAEAVRHLKQALACDPNHVPALVALSNVYLRNRKFSPLGKLLEEALSNRQDQAEVFFLKASMLNLQKDHAGASDAIATAIKLDEGQARYFRLASEIAWQRQDPNERQFFLERLIELDPLDGAAHYELGMLLRHPDDFQRVKLLLEIAIDLLPRKTKALYSLARHIHAGEKSLPDGTIRIEADPDHAKRLLRKLLSIEPDDGRAKLLLAQVESSDGEARVAKDLYSEALNDEETRGEAAYRLGLIWEEEGNFEKSIKRYKEAMKCNAWTAFAEFRLAGLLLREGKLEAAERHFRNCLPALEKKSADLTKSKEIHLQNLRFHESRKQLESLQSVRRFAGEAYLGIYKCNYASRQNEKVGLYLDKAIELYPHSSEANYEKGLLFLADDDIEKADDRLVKSVEHDWNHWPAHLELGKIAKGRDDFQKAEMHFKIVLDLDPKNKDASSLLGEIEQISTT